MGGKRMDLPWEVCRRIVVKEQKSAEAILDRKRAIPRSKKKGKNGSLTDKSKGRMLEWRGN